MKNYEKQLFSIFFQDTHLSAIRKFFNHWNRNILYTAQIQIHICLLLAFWIVCGGILGKFPDSSRSDPRKNGNAYHIISCAYQHLQRK